jgi:hypothetical protein
MKAVLITLVLALLAWAGASVAEPATTVRAVDLKAQPASDAKTVASFPVGQAVDIVSRQGAWVQLKAGTTLGWTKMFDVRLAPISGAAKPSGGSEALNLAMGNRGSSVTTGVRGLDADMLEKASPNPKEFNLLLTFMRNKEQATAFAHAGKLLPREVAVLNPADVTPPGAAKGGAQ